MPSSKKIKASRLLKLPVITDVQAYALRIPRNYALAQGSAGSPAALDTSSEAIYSLAKTYGTVYSNAIESMLVKITAEDGVIGWGEAQAPVAPSVTQTLVRQLIAPLLIGRVGEPVATRRMLYDAMRVRGHSGGFYIDALSAIDCALWDMAGKRHNVPVYRMLGGPLQKTVPVYISGLVGQTLEQRLADAHTYVNCGYRAFKIFMSETADSCVELVQHLRREFGNSIELFVDALWRLDEHTALKLACSLADLNVGWLESPLPPEDFAGHIRLAERSPIPIAAGECYRTRYEILPWLQQRALHYLQPDIGRSGVTEGMAIASLAETFNTPVTIHLSIALGPQIAAAIHASAAMPNLRYCEYNPHVLRAAETVCDMSGYSVSTDGFSLPDSPGFGIEPNQDRLDRFSISPQTDL